jgi:hypothetical protein
MITVIKIGIGILIALLDFYLIITYIKKRKILDLLAGIILPGLMFLFPLIPNEPPTPNTAGTVLKSEDNSKSKREYFTGILTTKEYKEYDGYAYFINKNNVLSKLAYANDEAVELNAKGTFVFDVLEGFVYFSNDKNELYKVRIDGTDLQSLGAENCSDVIIQDNIIYYLSSGTQADNAQKYLYRVRTDGTALKQISDIFISEYKISNSWIYAVNSENHNIYKMTTDGSKLDILYNKDEVKNIQVDEHWIYYNLFHSDYTGGSIYRISIYGEKEKNTKGKVIDFDFGIIDNFLLYGDYIYFTAALTKDYNGICRVKTDGSELKNIFLSITAKIDYIENDWIYYHDLTGHYKVYSDGNENQKLEKNKTR